MSVAELGTRLGLTSGAATKLVDRLDKKGYATRQPDPNDRRRAIVTPTREALDTARELEGALHQIAAKSLGKLSAPQRATLVDSLKAIADQFNQADTNFPFTPQP